MKWSKSERKELLIYVIVAYGVTFLMGILMGYGYKNGANVGLFPNAQMMYPAAGVMLAYLFVRKDDQMIPRRVFYTYLLVTVAIVMCTVFSIIEKSDTKITTAGTLGVNVWMAAGQFVVIGGSVIFLSVLLLEEKEKREAYGLRNKNRKASVWCVGLFILLYFLRTVIACGLSGQIVLFEIVMTDYRTWISLAALGLNFFLVCIAFFGEEYGWRYYLQPLMQKQFGKRWGVIFLGVVWGLWHLPVNFFYYSPADGLISAAGQQITCITLGIFFAYAYMKTENIWVPVILHFLNNNLIPILSGTYSENVIRNQSLSWSELLPALLLNGLIFGGFLGAKVFREKRSVPEK